jgi:hypothetical protein
MRASSLAALALLLPAASAQLAPSQRWVNFGRNPDELVISWTSSTNTDVCGWRILDASGNGPDWTWAGKPELATYSTPPVNSLPAYESDIIHRTYLSKLPTGRRLQYVVAVTQGDEATYTPPATVWTHPGVGPDVSSTLLVMADVEHRPSVLDALTDPLFNRSDRANAGGIILGASTQSKPHPPTRLPPS